MGTFFVCVDVDIEFKSILIFFDMVGVILSSEESLHVSIGNPVPNNIYHHY